MGGGDGRVCWNHVKSLTWVVRSSVIYSKWYTSSWIWWKMDRLGIGTGRDYESSNVKQNKTKTQLTSWSKIYGLIFESNFFEGSLIKGRPSLAYTHFLSQPINTIFWGQNLVCICLLLSLLMVWMKISSKPIFSRRQGK